jgi:hypothetical protein
VLIKPGETRGSFEDGEIAAMVEPAQGANIKKPPKMGRRFRLRSGVR